MSLFGANRAHLTLRSRRRAGVQQGRLLRRRGHQGHATVFLLSARIYSKSRMSSTLWSEWWSGLPHTRKRASDLIRRPLLSMVLQALSEIHRSHPAAAKSSIDGVAVGQCGLQAVELITHEVLTYLEYWKLRGSDPQASRRRHQDWRGTCVALNSTGVSVWRLWSSETKSAPLASEKSRLGFNGIRRRGIEPRTY